MPIYKIMYQQQWHNLALRLLVGAFTKERLTQIHQRLPAKRHLIAIFLGFILLMGRSYEVHGQSMEPTIQPNEYIIVEKASYLFTTPARGDVVIIGSQITGNQQLIKRVVGLANETLAIRNGVVYINDTQLDETYLLPLSIKSDYGPITIPTGHIFVLGDNRDNSTDSRTFGPVSLEKVQGHALFSYWPLHTIGLFG